MFSYYGSKANLARYYPLPKYGKIIEPFAGSAQYSLRHWKRDVLLVDKYEVVIRIWHWLQRCEPHDILSLPRLKEGELVSDYPMGDDAALFMGFVIAAAGQSPRNKASSRATTQRPKRIDTRLRTAANNLYKIRHWKIVQDDYRNISNQEATWFIDPPYQDGGHVYPIGNKGWNYCELSEWSRAREGQVIVCENITASWMPFVPVRDNKGNVRKKTEAMWTNFETHYHYKQSALFQGVTP